MRYTDDEIWRLTPRQFMSQLNVHEDVTKRMSGMNSSNASDAPTGFIDQIPGW